MSCSRGQRFGKQFGAVTNQSVETLALADGVLQHAQGFVEIIDHHLAITALTPLDPLGVGFNARMQRRSMRRQRLPPPASPIHRQRPVAQNVPSQWRRSGCITIDEQQCSLCAGIEPVTNDRRVAAVARTRLRASVRSTGGIAHAMSARHCRVDAAPPRSMKPTARPYRCAADDQADGCSSGSGC